MRLRHFLGLAMLLALWLTSGAVLAEQQLVRNSPFTERWVTANFDAIVDVDELRGEGHASLQGKIIWIFHRGRQEIVGQQLFSNMKPDGENRWRGRIYNPADERTYQGTVELAANGRSLLIRGCVGPFCRNQRWYRFRDVMATLPAPRR